MSVYEKEKAAGLGNPVSEESVCRYFVRMAQSLIVEPEVCEWCEFFEDGLCFRRGE